MRFYENSLGDIFVLENQTEYQYKDFKTKLYYVLDLSTYNTKAGILVTFFLENYFFLDKWFKRINALTYQLFLLYV
jgi:hypothetical protein